MRAPCAGGGRAAWLGLALLVGLACTTTGGASDLSERPPPAPLAIPPELRHEPLDADEVRMQPEALTVEESWILDLYTLTHSRDHRGFRVLLPDEDGEDVTAHLLLPPGPGPHATVVVFPILAGSMVVSEGLAKALVNRGYAVARVERRELNLDEAEDPQQVRDAFAAAIRDARRLLDWLETRPEVDAERLATAGVSLGSMLACTLQGVDPRIRAGFFAMTGGGLAEILYESREKPVRRFRDRMMKSRDLATREAFVSWVAGLVEPVEPLRYAPYIDAQSALMASGRFDRIIPPDRARALWEALGRPAWVRVPSGHYQMFPFFWYLAGRGADHFDAVLGR